METNPTLQVQPVVILSAETGAPVGRATCRAIVARAADGRIAQANISVHDLAWSPDYRPSLDRQTFDLSFLDGTRLRGSFPDYTPGAFASADARLAFAPDDVMPLDPAGGPGNRAAAGP
jgi:hypothetical protein